jgi:hypothetical protein
LKFLPCGIRHDFQVLLLLRQISYLQLHRLSANKDDPGPGKHERAHQR